VEGIESLKRDVFARLLEAAGRVFILVRYSGAARIGNRGFTEEEKKNGLVLVFTTGMKYAWDDAGIHASLVFASSPQKCFIPVGDIIAVHSPELGVQFAISPRGDDGRETALLDSPARAGAPGDKDISAEKGASAEVQAGNIIRVNFRKRGRGPAK